MDANQVFQLGPLQLPAAWIIAAAGVLLATYITEKMARKSGWEKEKWSDIIITAFIVFILTYKFGDGLIAFKQLIQNPEMLLWSSGSPISLFLAIIFALITLVYKVMKGNYRILEIIRLLWVFLSITIFIYHLFILDFGKTTTFFTGVSLENQSQYLYHPINWYKAVFIGINLVIFYWMNSKKQDKINIFAFYLSLGTGLIILSVFDISIHVYFGFTLEQIFYLLLGIVGVAGLFVYPEKEQTNV